MKLYLIRHGQTQANVNGVFCGSSDIVLTAEGERQAQHVARQLAATPLDALIHTDMRRSRDMAGIIAHGRELTIETQPLLQEMAFGEWEMRHHNELEASQAEGYQAWCQDWQKAEVPQGESFTAFTSRIRQALQQLHLRPQESRLAIVAHQGSLSLLLAMMLKLAPADMWRFPFKQGCLCEIDLSPGTCVIQRFNDSGI
ncbi:alpha-ribazole phosphatase [Rahnella sp. C60]|uniref:Alpha-ribazole phosphatase n=1 Tax=Rahnella perminowiae TaxID=2816244 RepID=A0ABS6L122_9GAMM|nr:MULTISPECIES: alpha-ribazole phosphatase [Rahnella]UJD89734.1 alpha-ribazole phosphatase [Rahnella aquatilis]MBU9809158.1 alpha-ribazole phosphatase [Rahnella perminowiae]MBU9817910.1 alpha-ribazole phosphatase [Rahnella perminowiae]MBU9827677.1 alpha-ribazole phosphatase [Rahnella perminowiae]MBU9835413.1 alpha-ribazole phosphatase [Rahnella perminowiae]